MSSLLRSLALSAVGAFSLTGAAIAADLPVAPAEPVFIEEVPESAFDITFGVTALSDYVFRGISQTDRDPAIQGFAEATYSMFYLGVFASNLDFEAPDPDVEIDIYGGIRPTFGNLTLDLGAIYYIYEDEVFDTDFVELVAGASYNFNDRLTLGAKAFYAPDVSQSDTEALYVEASAAVPLPYDFSLSGAVGHQSFESAFGEDYVTWNAGVSYTFRETLTFDVRYHDTDLDEGDCFLACGETIVASVSLRSSLSKLRGVFGNR